MNKPFSIKYSWSDFSNTSELTQYQKHRIKKRYEQDVKVVIQDIINESIKDRAIRREELEEHKNPKEPFRLDIGGEG